MPTFITIPCATADGSPLDPDTYLVDTDDERTTAKIALRNAGIESAEVWSGEPDEGEAVKTDLVLLALSDDEARERVIDRATARAARLVELLGPGSGHPDGVWDRDQGDHLWTSPEGETSAGRLSRDFAMDGIDDDDLERDARKAFVAAYEEAWDAAEAAQ